MSFALCASHFIRSCPIVKFRLFDNITDLAQFASWTILFTGEYCSYIRSNSNVKKMEKELLVTLTSADPIRRDKFGQVAAIQKLSLGIPMMKSVDD
jgi:hypothetical protein